MKSDNATIKNDFEKLFSQNHELKTKFLDAYLYILTRLRTDESITLISKELDSLKSVKDLSESDMVVLAKYSNIVGDDGSKYEKQLLEKFPKNKYAEEVEYGKLMEIDNPSKKEEAFTQFKNKYPNSELVAVASYQVIRTFIDKGDIKETIAFANKFENEIHPYGFKYTIKKLLDANDFTNAKVISEIAVNANRTHLNKMDSPKPAYYTGSEWKDELKQNLGDALKTLAMIQKEFGDNETALVNAEEAQKYFNDDDIELNELYASLLIYNKKFKKAKTELENYFEENKSSSIMIDMLKTTYVQQNKTEEGFDEYFTRFASAGEARLISKLKSEMLNEDAPDFELKDLNNKLVKFSDLKGKVVVVDFWATWCGPCKRSFPAMQKANNSFKNDNNVKFLFVNTWEGVDDKLANAKEFISENKYKLEILLDDKNEVASKFGVTGIPTKFIIGPNQKIRFKSIGFGGTNEELVKEITAMIKLVKNSSKK